MLQIKILNLEHSSAHTLTMLALKYTLVRFQIRRTVSEVTVKASKHVRRVKAESGQDFLPENVGD